jgi:hypothetical protein
MKTGSVESGLALSGPAIITILVITLGATIYLWQTRYIKRQTAFVFAFVVIVALVCIGAWTYLHPMRDIGL